MTERDFNRDELDFGSFERSRDLRLVTAAVLNADTGKLLMIAWQNEAAVEQTFVGGEMVFYKRSANNLWLKGETSGNKLFVVKQAVNCENNTIKYYVEPVGPTCHTGAESCWDLND